MWFLISTLGCIQITFDLALLLRGLKCDWRWVRLRTVQRSPEMCKSFTDSNFILISVYSVKDLAWIFTLDLNLMENCPELLWQPELRWLQQWWFYNVKLQRKNKAGKLWNCKERTKRGKGASAWHQNEHGFNNQNRWIAPFVKAFFALFIDNHSKVFIC